MVNTPTRRRTDRFNPRPSVRGDNYDVMTTVDRGLFQSTPLREGRLRCYRTDDYDKVFQSTPLREGRHKCNEWLDAADSFNPRPSVRGDAD